MRVKRPKNVKDFFYKTNAEKNGTFNMQIILKGGSNYARTFCDTWSKLPICVQKHIFSIWATFSNPCGAVIANF